MSPERLLAVVHGFAEHSARYEELGSWFAREGFAVHAYDQQGHGRSAGLKNYVRRFDDFLDDLDCFLEIVKTEHPGLPCTLLGHSMGGLVVTAYVRERKPDLAGLVTSGAAVALGPGVSRAKVLLARVLRGVAPRLAMDAGLPLAGLSRDPEVIRRYVEDPLIVTRITASLAAEMMDAVSRTAGGGAAIEIPMLLLHGGDDPLCPPSGSEEFYASLRPSGANALRVYPGLRHEIFNEPEKEDVFRDLLAWVCEEVRETAPARDLHSGACVGATGT